MMACIKAIVGAGGKGGKVETTGPDCVTHFVFCCSIVTLIFRSSLRINVFSEVQALRIFRRRLHSGWEVPTRPWFLRPA